MATILAGNVSAAMRKTGKDNQHRTEEGDQVGQRGKGYKGKGRKGKYFSI